MKLIPLLIFLGSISSLSAQFSLSVTTGYGFSNFNRTPTVADVGGGPSLFTYKLYAQNGWAYAIVGAYRFRNDPISVVLRIQAHERGYWFKRSMTHSSSSFLVASTNNIDVMPSLQYRLGKHLSFHAGPFLSRVVTRYIVDTDLRNLYRLHPNDYGLHGGVQYALGRFFISGHFQRSFRDFSLRTFKEQFSSAYVLSGHSPISTLVLSGGYQIIGGKKHHKAP